MQVRRLKIVDESLVTRRYSLALPGVDSLPDSLRSWRILEIAVEVQGPRNDEEYSASWKHRYLYLCPSTLAFHKIVDDSSPFSIRILYIEYSTSNPLNPSN